MKKTFFFQKLFWTILYFTVWKTGELLDPNSPRNKVLWIYFLKILRFLKIHRTSFKFENLGQIGLIFYRNKLRQVGSFDEKLR
jgi:hypothetical protein